MGGEDGFSLAEMLVAITVGFLVLGVAYLLLETGLKGFRDIENNTAQSRALADSLERIAKPLREGTGVSTASPYELTFVADGDDDGAIERYRFYMAAGSTNLMEDIGDPISGAATQTVTVSNIVRNRVTNVPLFTYFEGMDESLSGTTTVTANLVHLKITVQRQTTPPPSPYSGELDVYLRNVGQ
jgi:hypothetical protein